MHDDEYNAPFSLSVFKKLARFLVPYTKTILLALAPMCLLGILDASYTLLERYAIDRFVETGRPQGLAVFVAVFMAVVIVQGFNGFFMYSIAMQLSVSVSYDIRKEAFSHLQKLSLSYYDKTQVGWIVARVGQDTYNLAETAAWCLVDVLWAISSIVFVGFAMLALNWRLGLVILSIILPLALLTGFFQSRILKYNRLVRASNSRLTGAINEGIMGAKTAKILAVEKKNEDEFHEKASDLARASVRSAIVSSLFLPTVMSLGSAGTALILTLGGMSLASGAETFAGHLTAGTLAAFLIYSTQIFEPLQTMARNFANMVSSQASAERIASLLEAPLDVIDSPQAIRAYGDETNPIRENWPRILGNIDVENVTYSYSGADNGENVLTDFSLHVPAGTSVAFVGETGAGKSTIVNLICRFYEPNSGRVLIDGTDLRDMPQIWIQSGIGYVLQDPHLFSGTIRENIRYGRLDASDEEVEEAARIVNVHDTVMSLPEGYDTQVLEGGARLSVGERQLISIARAVLADPAIFILDEATSSVDTITERRIQQAVDYLMKGRTSLIIAHRLSTVKSVDRIILIENGTIVEDGSHESLTAAKGRYFNLCQKQFISDENQEQAETREGIQDKK